MKQEIREMIYKGSAKRLYETDKAEFIIQEFKDDTSLVNGKKKAKVRNKGAFNNEISSYIFEYLAGFHIPTHYVRHLSNCEMLVKRLEIFPLELVVRNVAAGSFCEQLGMKEGLDLPHPIIEHYLKTNRSVHPMVNEFHILALGIASPEELRQLNRLASKVNVVLKSFFGRREIKLVDLTLEFGRHNGLILLGDEITPDTCRLWDRKTNKKLSAEHFRQDVEAMSGVYEEIRNRVCTKVA